MRTIAMSGQNFRVVLGTGEAVRYRLCDSEKEARGLAADAIHQAVTSHVAVEENRRGQWVPVNSERSPKKQEKAST
jgi:hypothetical protein